MSTAGNSTRLFRSSAFCILRQKQERYQEKIEPMVLLFLAFAIAHSVVVIPWSPPLLALACLSFEEEYETSQEMLTKGEEPDDGHDLSTNKRKERCSGSYRQAVGFLLNSWFLVDIFLLLLFHIFSLKKREKREEEDRELTARYNHSRVSVAVYSLHLASPYARPP